MMGNRTKFLLLGIIIAVLGVVFFMNLIPLPFDMTVPIFDLLGFGLTIPLLMIIIGVLLAGISRLFSF